MKKEILVTRKVFEALSWWKNPQNLRLGLDLSVKIPSHVVTTDASGYGWGAVKDKVHHLQGLWDQNQRKWYINALKLKAVELGLWKFRFQLRNRLVLVRSDNVTTFSYINKMGGHKVSSSMSSVLEDDEMVEALLHKDKSSLYSRIRGCTSRPSVSQISESLSTITESGLLDRSERMGIEQGSITGCSSHSRSAPDRPLCNRIQQVCLAPFIPAKQLINRLQ